VATGALRHILLSPQQMAEIGLQVAVFFFQVLPVLQFFQSVDLFVDPMLLLDEHQFFLLYLFEEPMQLLLLLIRGLRFGLDGLLF
jgi:hypothetical protein